MNYSHKTLTEKKGWIQTGSGKIFPFIDCVSIGLTSFEKGIPSREKYLNCDITTSIKFEDRKKFLKKDLNKPIHFFSAHHHVVIHRPIDVKKTEGRLGKKRVTLIAIRCALENKKFASWERSERTTNKCVTPQESGTVWKGGN